MKGIRLNIGFAFFLLPLVFLTSCNRPETIGRGELKRIFKEAFLVNAYYDTSHGRGIDLDSLDMYGPILARHGYDVGDLEYTVGVYAKKKSANLSRIVEQAIAELKEESAYYDGRLAQADSLYSIADRLLRREVLWRDSIVVRRAADTAKLRIAIPAGEGSYDISYSYIIDTIDKNRNLRATFSLVDSLGEWTVPKVEYMTRRGVLQRPVSRTIEADGSTVELEIAIGNYPQRDMTTPRMRVDSLSVVYHMPREKALDSISGRWRNLGKYGYQAHSGAPCPLPPWVDTLAVGGVR